MVGDALAGFHPGVIFFYFAAVIGLAMFFFHPVMLGATLVCGAVYALYLKGRGALKWGLFLLPLLLVTAGLNPLFNHRGVTILGFLPNGNPVTLEAVLYGGASAVMLVAVVLWFVCLNAVMTGEKWIFLFGRVLPALSLVLSMTMRLVPRFLAQGRVIYAAQKGLQRRVNPLKVLSILVTWALENAVETADSMNARGYGLAGRTAFGLYRFGKRDALALGFIFFCAMVVIFGSSAVRFQFFPRIIMHEINAGAVGVFVVYLALGAFPMILNGKEAMAWKRIESRM